MGTKTVTKPKKLFRIGPLPKFDRISKFLISIIGIIGFIGLSYLLAPSNIVLGAIYLINFGFLFSFIGHTLYGLVLFFRYFI